MKKLIFMLLVMAMGAGVVFAASGPIHPPCAYSLEAALSEYSVDGHAVTSDTVLVTDAPVTADLLSFEAIVVLYSTAIRPHSGMINLARETREKVDKALSAIEDYVYHLRC